MAAVCGDAAEAEVLIQSHIARAAALVVTVPDAVAARRMVETARALNPDVRVVLRAASGDEAEILRGEGVGAVYVAEEELARGILRATTAAMGDRS